MKLWHFSDPHFSFNERGEITKPMDKRLWSIGSSNYVGYIDAILQAQSLISDQDIVCITGDLGHDLGRSMVMHQIKWMNDNLKGAAIVCIKGNHDRSWDFNKLRLLPDMPSRIHLLDEGETLTLGKFTFGCYSNHEKQVRDDLSEPWYANKTSEVHSMGDLLVKQSKAKNTIPVFLSHYPAYLHEAEYLGSIGIKAYLSGHVHCTSGKAEGGTDWQWYNKSAAYTDDKTINGCFFSTGTTDVLLQKHKKIIKEIQLGNRWLHHSKNPKLHAADMFECSPALAKPFTRKDPFNPQNELSGFICVQKGKMQGSLLITHINGLAVSEQLIYGVPKMQYPYKGNTQEYQVIKASRYMMVNKWNGMNVLFFKYFDQAGSSYISAKSKGAPLLSDCEYGQFLTLTQKALMLPCHYSSTTRAYINSLLSGPYGTIQSISMELCGKLEPHLVSYDFDIALEPLFITRMDGEIVPIDFGYNSVYMPENIISAIKDSQQSDFERNESYRRGHGLPLKYEFNHFQCEGKVLYPLDDSGAVIDRIMYKIKPKDIEEVHWQAFDGTMIGRVNEAISKIHAADGQITEDSLRDELDMGPKEWGKFGREIMKHAFNHTKKVSKVVILVGNIGSGKTTYARELETKGFVRINQDELGSANKCKDAMRAALENGQDVVIDRTNIDKLQRKRWLDIAKTYRVSDIKCIWLDTPKETCINRIITRTGHPTINDNMPSEAKIKIWESFNKNFIPPSTEEGFSSIENVTI